MATYVSIPTGSAANWCTNTSWYNVESGTRGFALSSSTSNPTNTTTSYVYNGDAQDITGTNAKNCVGIIMFCKQTTTTGTVTVGLSADSGTTRTVDLEVNATDLPTAAGLVFFKFASPLALDGGTDYAICVRGSSAGNATFYRNSSTAADWIHGLVWGDSPASAITTGDITWIVGAVTGAGTTTTSIINMDETTTTVYGNCTIGNLGTLSFDATSAYNPYLKMGGNLYVSTGGTLNIGTVATPIPRDSIAVLEFDCASEKQYGIYLDSTGTVVAQGLSRTSGKNVVGALLNVDTVNTETHFHLDTDTGWLSGDTVAIASTSQSPSQAETKILDGDAGAEICNVTVAFGATVHSGTSPTQGEVINLTRNVKIRSASATYDFKFYLYSDTGNVDFDWVEIYRYSDGYLFDNYNMAYCSFHDSHTKSIYNPNSSGTGIVFTYCVFYNLGSAASAKDPVNLYKVDSVITNCYFMKFSSSGNSLMYIYSGSSSNFSNNTISSMIGYPALLFGSACMGTIDNINVHSNGKQGIWFRASPITLTNSKIWRNYEQGLVISQTNQSGGYMNDITLRNLLMFGNDNYYQVDFQTHYSTTMKNIVFDNVSIYGDTSFATQFAIYFEHTIFIDKVYFYNCDFGTASGIYTNHSVSDIRLDGNSESGGTLMFENCLFATGFYNYPSYYKIYSNNHNRVKGGRYFDRYGSIMIDNTVYNDGTYTNTAPSERVTPSSATVRIESGKKKVSLLASATTTISVYVRKSSAGDGDTASYNGADEPRLILKRSDGMGVTADVVCDTMTAAVGDWEVLTYTTSVGQALLDGVLEFCVDCDGTTGWVNIDAWSLS